MKVIPVLDLKQGLVVAARQGQREHYQPITSRLCASAEVFRVLEGFLALAEFDTFYIADLDALMGNGNHDALIRQIAKAFPQKQFWLDKGCLSALAPLDGDNVVPVLGSESYTDENVHELINFSGRFVLSLDFLGNASLGAGSLFRDSALWPKEVIVMSLSQVGSGLGPDWIRLKHYRQNHLHNIIAAGGIRNSGDLATLASLGISQALVASALHSGAISSQDLQACGQKNTSAS